MIVAAVIAAFICFLVNQAGSSEGGAGYSETTGANEESWSSIFYNGEEYVHDNNKSVLLFMGLDAGGDTQAEGIGSNSRCDTIILFIMDNSDNTIQMLDMSRNSMVSVDVYEDNGNDKLYSTELQICMQFTYSNSLKRGSYLMKRKVAEVLGGIEIDDYLTLEMDAMVQIVDELGGLTITMEEDCTNIDEAYTEGAVVELDGAATERFLRYRGVEESGTNESVRMSHHKWFMRQAFSQIKGMGASKIQSLLNTAGDKADTSMYADTMASLLRYSLNEEVLTVPGSVTEGVHDEYYLDNDKVKEQIISLLYAKK